MSICRSFVLLACIILLSCTDGLRSVGDNPDGPPSQPIGGGIRFSVSERPPYQNYGAFPRIFLDMRTVCEYGCCNYEIICEIAVEYDEIVVQLAGIFVPDICATAIGPATGSEILNIKQGHYTLVFAYAGLRDTYDLDVTQDAIIVSPIEADFTEPNFGLFWRPVPNSFAYSCGGPDSTAWICDDFLDTLLVNLDLTELSFPDSGEIPLPRSSTGHYFIYGADDDFAMAGSLLEFYSKAVICQYRGTSITLVNWKGERYLSWLLDKR